MGITCPPTHSAPLRRMDVAWPSPVSVGHQQGCSGSGTGRKLEGWAWPLATKAVRPMAGGRKPPGSGLDSLQVVAVQHEPGSNAPGYGHGAAGMGGKGSDMTPAAV